MWQLVQVLTSDWTSGIPRVLIQDPNGMFTLSLHAFLQVIWFRHEWVIEWCYSTDSFNIADSFTKQVICLYEWVIKTFTQPINSTILIHSVTKQVNCLNKKVNETFTQPIHWTKLIYSGMKQLNFLYERVTESFTSHWIINSLHNLFVITDESLNHLLLVHYCGFSWNYIH